MIGHQCIGVDITIVFLTTRGQQIQVQPIVVICKETGLAIVAALSDMLGYIRQIEPCRAWQFGHSGMNDYPYCLPVADLNMGEFCSVSTEIVSGPLKKCIRPLNEAP